MWFIISYIQQMFLIWNSLWPLSSICSHSTSCKSSLCSGVKMASSVANVGRLFWRSSNKLQRFAAPVALNATQQRDCKLLERVGWMLKLLSAIKFVKNISLTLGLRGHYLNVEGARVFALIRLYNTFAMIFFISFASYLYITLVTNHNQSVNLSSISWQRVWYIYLSRGLRKN